MLITSLLRVVISLYNESMAMVRGPNSFEISSISISDFRHLVTQIDSFTHVVALFVFTLIID